MNVALDGNGATADGGALWNNSSLDVANGTVSRSTAGGNGAGVWNDGVMTLTNVHPGCQQHRVRHGRRRLERRLRPP